MRDNTTGGNIVPRPLQGAGLGFVVYLFEKRRF
jgi:hypothetical protein